MTDSAPHRPLPAEELHQRLEALVYPVLSVRRSVKDTAEALATLGRSKQDRFIQGLQLIVGTSVELGYNFCMFGSRALSLLDKHAWQDWVLHLMDRYDQGGVLAAIVAMQHVADYAETARLSRTGVRFEEVSGVLECLVLGLNGRLLKLAAGEATHTDTETLFLPALAGRFAGREDNFKLHKAMAVHLWAQTWYGTWRLSLVEAARQFPDPQRAVRLFHALETARLDACIARELPGMHRDMMHLREVCSSRALSPAWEQAAQRLSAREARVQDSYELLPMLYREPDDPEPACYQGVLVPEQTERVQAARIRHDRETLGKHLAALLAAHPRSDEGSEQQSSAGEKRLSVAEVPAAETPDGFRFELRLDGAPITPLPEVQQTLDSVAQDLGEIPDEYLVPAGHGAYRPAAGDSGRAEAVADTEAKHCYDEWDHARKQYRRDWCLLRERDVHPQWDDFVERTLAKYRGLLKHLRRTFEALRGQEKLLKREPHGDDIDIDAVVESYADRRVGLEASERLFTRRRRVERDIAVMLLVDMSGSTKGRINDIERESLVLLCEVLETLGDRYAIYGFSGFTHKRCEILRVKRLDEPYDATVRARISGIRPQDYTRMGTAIRHLTGQFREVEARTRLLITLSDGRPDTAARRPRQSSACVPVRDRDCQGKTATD